MGIRGSELRNVCNEEYRLPSNIAHLNPYLSILPIIARVGRVILILPGFLPTLVFVVDIIGIESSESHADVIVYRTSSTL